MYMFLVPISPKLLNVHNLVNKQTDKTNHGDHEYHPDQEKKYQQENDELEQDHEERRLSGKFSGLEKMKKLKTIQR